MTRRAHLSITSLSISMEKSRHRNKNGGGGAAPLTSTTFLTPSRGIFSWFILFLRISPLLELQKKDNGSVIRGPSSRGEISFSLGTQWLLRHSAELWLIKQFCLPFMTNLTFTILMDMKGLQQIQLSTQRLYDQFSGHQASYHILSLRPFFPIHLH